MTTFHIVNFGCRATQADAAAIERQLIARGCARADSPDAQFVVVNTCTVTAAADTQARQAIRQIHRDHPYARIVVTGCYAQRAPEELASLDGVAWVVGNSHRTQIPHLLECGGSTPLSSGVAATAMQSIIPLASLLPEGFSLDRAPTKILTGNIFAESEVLVAPVEGHEASRTRPILKIQDGCNNRCAYCVIPFVRGRSRSLPPARVVEEVRRLVDAGAREIVLSGINLGSYGRDLAPRVELAGVVRRILDETSLEQLRISSVEPMDVTQDWIELVASTPRIAPHFHIPLQSGSDRVLARMHRWYRTEHYARRVEMIRELLPDAGIGADVIVGFPGETGADHAATLELVRALPFTYLHVFSFSARPGTSAATLDGQVPPQVIRQRARELRALATEKSAAFRAAHLGRTLRVLTLHTRDAQSTGAISGNYLKVRVAGAYPANTWLDARVTSTRGDSLLATLHR